MRTEHGTSLISAIVGIALTALAFGLGLGVIRVVFATTGVARDTGRGAAEIARFVNYVTFAAGRVWQPIWLGSPAVTRGKSALGIGFVDGDRDSTLELEWASDGIVVRITDDEVSFPRLIVSSVEVSSRPPAHLVVSLRTPRLSTVTVTAPFGSFPLPIP